MNIELIESQETKQFLTEPNRVNVSEEQKVAELRLSSDQNDILTQIPASEFLEWESYISAVLGSDEADEDDLEINVSHIGESDNDCGFCHNENVHGFHIPVTLDIGINGDIYPAISGGSSMGVICYTCAALVRDELQKIIDERRDLIVAHEL